MKITDIKAVSLPITEVFILTIAIFVAGWLLGFVMYDGSGYNEGYYNGYNNGFQSGGTEAVYVFEDGASFYDTYWYSIDESIRNFLITHKIVISLEEFRRVCIEFENKEGF